jgi:trypsin-like peptidase
MQLFTAAAIPIDLLRRDPIHGEIVGATGTAFLYELDGTYLVTAWHNVTGYDHIRKKLLHSKGFLPEILRYGIWRWVGQKNELGQRRAIRDWREVNLLESEPTWFQHPEKPGEIDICVMPIEYDNQGQWLSRPINNLDIESRLIPEPGQESLVIGFPENISGPLRTAIWKRASVASEAALPHEGNDFFYVDTATRKGMSGSPVIIRHHGYFDPDKVGDQASPTAVIGTVENFCGIYVGRVGDDELGVQLGIVWKENVIREVISALSPGRNPAA